ncbi:hypothetical protein GCM10023238_07290 [Streptomyces heliomycini]
MARLAKGGAAGRTPGPAELLRMVHALPAPPFALPPRELLGGVERWLRLAGDAVDRRTRPTCANGATASRRPPRR